MQSDLLALVPLPFLCADLPQASSLGCIPSPLVALQEETQGQGGEGHVPKAAPQR